MGRTAAAEQMIRQLELAPLPGEGGFFRVTWRNATASAIHFLLTPKDFSALHVLTRDELWHFHAGDPVEHLQLDPATGALHRTRLGPAVLQGDASHVAVPAGRWQGARLQPKASVAPQGFALFSCVVSPPWEDECCTLGRRDELERIFPAHAEWVRTLTR